jgi:hypothetical protein
MPYWKGACACVGCEADAWPAALRWAAKDEIQRLAGTSVASKREKSIWAENSRAPRNAMHRETDFRRRIAQSQTRRLIHLLGAVHHSLLQRDSYGEITADTRLSVIRRHSRLFVFFTLRCLASYTRGLRVLTTGTRAGRNKEVVSVAWHLSRFVFGTSCIYFISVGSISIIIRSFAVLERVRGEFVWFFNYFIGPRSWFLSVVTDNYLQWGIHLPNQHKSGLKCWSRDTVPVLSIRRMRFGAKWFWALVNVYWGEIHAHSCSRTRILVFYFYLRSRTLTLKALEETHFHLIV